MSAATEHYTVTETVKKPAPTESSQANEQETHTGSGEANGEDVEVEDEIVTPSATNVLFLLSDQHRADAIGHYTDLVGSLPQLQHRNAAKHFNFRAQTPYVMAMRTK